MSISHSLSFSILFLSPSHVFSVLPPPPFSSPPSLIITLSSFFFFQSFILSLSVSRIFAVYSSPSDSFSICLVFLTLARRQSRCSSAAVQDATFLLSSAILSAFSATRPSVAVKTLETRIGGRRGGLCADVEKLTMPWIFPIHPRRVFI